MQVRPLFPSDWPSVLAAYEEGLATGHATFETTAPSWEQWDAAHSLHARLVAVDDNTVFGWAALTPVSRRKVYSGVAEASVYIRSEARGRGVGRLLLTSLISESEAAGIWTLQASIFPENTASVGLFSSCGFREVGRRERIAQLASVWRDTVLLERRSSTI